MKKPFKIGDRVNIYNSLDLPQQGTIESFNSQKCICIKLANGGTSSWWHPKQCRRLVKRKRYTLWIKRAEVPEGPEFSTLVRVWGHHPDASAIKFVETKKR